MQDLAVPGRELVQGPAHAFPFLCGDQSGEWVVSARAGRRWRRGFQRGTAVSSPLNVGDDVSGDPPNEGAELIGIAGPALAQGFQGAAPLRPNATFPVSGYAGSLRCHDTAP
jgi:hypothetical protein